VKNSSLTLAQDDGSWTFLLAHGKDIHLQAEDTQMLPCEGDCIQSLNADTLDALAMSLNGVQAGWQAGSASNRHAAPHHAHIPELQNPVLRGNIFGNPSKSLVHMYHLGFICWCSWSLTDDNKGRKTGSKLPCKTTRQDRAASYLQACSHKHVLSDTCQCTESAFMSLPKGTKQPTARICHSSLASSQPCCKPALLPSLSVSTLLHRHHSTRALALLPASKPPLLHGICYASDQHQLHTDQSAIQQER
jgi:hypothetical protein